MWRRRRIENEKEENDWRREDYCGQMGRWNGVGAVACHKVFLTPKNVFLV